MNFYKPILAKSVSKPFSGKDWIFEAKLGCFRAIVYVRDNLFTVQSRNSNEFKRNFPEIEEITQLAKNVVVDGEIVIMKQGNFDFHALQERGHLISCKDVEKLQRPSPATYVVFNILEKDDKSVIDLPLKEKLFLKRHLTKAHI
jgi:bifunctional non-homologous end joining protein LigD